MHLHLVTNGSTAGGNGKPSVNTNGAPILKGSPGLSLEEGFSDATPLFARIVCLVEAVVTAAGAGSIAYVKLWGWFPAAYGANKWFPLGKGADATRGKLNDGAAIGEVATADDLIRFAETVDMLTTPTRIYAEYGALTSIDRLDITLVGRF